MDEIYYQKYLKYKSKYLQLQKLSGGDELSDGVKTIMSDMDNRKNDIKKAIDAFLKTLTPEQKKDIPKDKTFGTTDEYQIFRFIIYLLVKNNIDININIFDKFNQLELNQLTKFADLTEDQFKKISDLEYSEIGYLTNYNEDDIKKFLKLKQDQLKIVLSDFNPQKINIFLKLDEDQFNIFEDLNLLKKLAKLNISEFKDFTNHKIEQKDLDKIKKLDIIKPRIEIIYLDDTKINNLLDFINNPETHFNKYTDIIKLIPQELQIPPLKYTREEIIGDINNIKGFDDFIDFLLADIPPVVALNFIYKLKSITHSKILRLKKGVFDKLHENIRKKILEPENMKNLINILINNNNLFADLSIKLLQNKNILPYIDMLNKELNNLDKISKLENIITGGLSKFLKNN